MISPMLAVKDVDISVAFYTQKLGFKHDFSMPDANGKNTFAWVSLGKSGFGLQLDPHLEHRGNGVVFMFPVLDEAEVDEYYAQVQANSVAILEPIADQPWGDRSFMVKDPDGYVLSPYKTLKQLTTEEMIAAMHKQVQVI